MSDTSAYQTIGTRDQPSGISDRARSINVSIAAADSATASPDPRAPAMRIKSLQGMPPRKKLPWLDGPQNSRPGWMPGQFIDSNDALPLDNLRPVPMSSTVASPPPVTPGKRPSRMPEKNDPAFRATGSVPSLRERTKMGDNRTLSLGSQGRPKARGSIAAPDMRRVAGAVTRDNRAADYASSEYSITQSSESRDVIPAAHTKKDPASYERLIDRRSSRQAEFSTSGDPRQQSQSFTTLEPQLSPQHRRHPRRSSQGYVSPGEPLTDQQWPRLRDMPRAKTLSRRTFPVDSPARAPDPVVSSPGPPARKPTLYAMPTHLMLSSSSLAMTSLTPNERPIQTAPTPQPPRRASGAHKRSRSRSLDRAVTGLENLMGEALSVARSAAQTGRTDEVADILGNATTALRRASSSAKDVRRNGRMSQPLVLSPVHSESNDSAIVDSDISSLRSHGHSIETGPTVLTQSHQSSRQPVVADRIKSDVQSRRSERSSVPNMPFRSTRSEDSIARTPPRLYQPQSAESVVRDFAYARARTAKAEQARALSKSVEWGAAANYYRDMGESVVTQPGVRPSINPPMFSDEPSIEPPGAAYKPSRRRSRPSMQRATTEFISPSSGLREDFPLRHVDAAPTTAAVPPRRSSRSYEKLSDVEQSSSHRRPERHPRHPHLAHLFESRDYRPDRTRGILEDQGLARAPSEVTDTSGPPALVHRDISLKHPRRKHVSLREGQGFSLGRFHRRQPIAREWSTPRKRMTAAIACLNTVFIGLIAGIYAGEVPRIQYQLADTTQRVILGNVLLFAFLGATTLIFWPLPLLHGRKPYTLLGFAIILPLLFPQAIAVTGYHSPSDGLARCGLLIPRAFMGIAMGFANINFLPTLFDLFGASLMPDKPHQELVVYDDVRRQGGGVGVWLGIWSFCFVGSMSIGFCIGAVIISTMDPSWGFYIIVILVAVFLLVNVIAPETRRSPYRRSIAQFLDGEDNVKRRIARGEIKLHISNEGPKFWWQEVWAGLILSKRMATQPGFFVLMLYLAWMYAQVTLVILLLGALLSRNYKWQPQYVGAASLAMAIGAFLAMPLSKANLFSRARDQPQRTDSMTMRHAGHVTWTSHMLRRCIFTLTLPFAAGAYTLSSPGPSISWVAPAIFCALVGFLSNLAIAECVGLIMETFDTCDLQPGVNSKHRLQSLAETTRRRRTNYSAFPRVCAGFFTAQALGFVLSAAATGVSGDVTRAVGAQIATAIVAAILLAITLLFIAVLWRWKAVQVVPNNPRGEASGTGVVWGPAGDDPEWKAVIIGNPSGKMRRVNLLELGDLSRWTEIRKLNKLIHH